MTTTATSQSPPAVLSHPGRGSPSLCDLPPEIKGMILDEIAEMGATNIWARPRSPMCAISLVSREFAALAEPYLWSHMDFYEVPCERFSHFLAHILPQHASHVTRLDLPSLVDEEEEPKSFDRNYELDESDVDPELVLARSVAAMESPLDGSPLNLLLRRTIGSMTKLSTVRCDLLQLREVFEMATSRWGAEGQSWAGCGTTARDSSVAGALAALGPRLLHLIIIGDGTPDYNDDRGAIKCTGNGLAWFLNNFPSLSRLVLVVPIEAVGRDSIISTLSSFRHLTFLELECGSLVNPSFASAAWACPLETLFLIDIESLSIPTLSKLFTHFSATLKSLGLHEAPSDQRSLVIEASLPPSGVSFPLPHLSSLVLCTPSLPDRHLLSTFAPCPLKNLTFHPFPDESSTRWHDFVQSHLDTLRRVTIKLGSSRDLWTVGLVDPVQKLCGWRGVECLVKESMDYGVDVEQ